MTDIPGQRRGWVRPLHPMFTHFPIAAYVLAAGFDAISVFGGPRRSWSGQLWHAGTYVLIGGLAICLVTMMTGFADLIRFGERRAPVVRLIAVHVCIMAGVFMIGVGDLALRLADLHRASTPPVILVLTIAAAIGVCTGASFGGTLVYKHGAGVMATRGSDTVSAVDPNANGAGPAHVPPARSEPGPLSHQAPRE
jgi:uncharacterized membrane protein